MITKRCSIINVGFFRIARLASLKSSYRVKVGCVIALHGVPVSIGFNRVKSHPRSAKRCKTLHAEMDAIISAQTSLDGGIAYVYRERADGSLGLSRPCLSCYKALSQAGIKKIYYSTKIGYSIERMQNDNV